MDNSLRVVWRLAVLVCLVFSACSVGDADAPSDARSTDVVVDAGRESDAEPSTSEADAGDASSDANDPSDASSSDAADAADDGGVIPWGPTSCVDGTPSDLVGLTAVCSGTLEKWSLATGGTATTIGPSDYTFDFVFGSDWPGSLDGFEVVFALPPDRYAAIPFKPTAHASTSLQLEPYRSEGKLGRFMTISTAPGLFNDGKPNGTTVLCSTTETRPTMEVSTDGTPRTCALDPDTVYWLNIAPDCSLSTCGVGVKQAPVFNETCVNGTTGDLPGYTAVCEGGMTMYTPIATPLGPSPYTFDFVFGAQWPGSRSGLAVKFPLGAKQFIAIPFRPDPMSGVQISMNDSYMGGGKYQMTISVSTAPGLFDPNTPGVIVSKSKYPNVLISSTGYSLVDAKLDPSKVYWLNLVVGQFWQGTWTGCNELQCPLAFSNHVLGM